MPLPPHTSTELLEEWDWETGLPTGRAVTREEAHRNGTPHEAIHLWIVRNARRIPSLLFQHRAAHKQHYPDCLDITVAGHVPYGYCGSKIAKEAHEEIGIIPDERDLIDLGWYRYCEHTGDLHQREFQHVYLMKDDRPLNEYRFRDGEVCAVCEVTLDDLKRLIESDVSIETRRYDGFSITTTTVKRSDFHPQLFDRSMEAYMMVLLKALDELRSHGRIITRLPEP